MNLPVEPAETAKRDGKAPESELRLRFPSRLDTAPGARPGIGPEDLARK